MVKNYLKIAFRHLRKTKTFFTINVLGLAIGMAACLLILHYINFEKSYDKFHESSERVYRLRVQRTSHEGTIARFSSCCPPAGPLIRANYPEVEELGRIYRYKASVSYKDNKFNEKMMFFAEDDFLSVFKIEFIDKLSDYDLTKPKTAYISESTAQKYFGDENPMGKTFYVDKVQDYMVAGVFKDIRENSHLKFDILLDYPDFITLRGQELQEAWGHTGIYTYLRLRADADPIAFENKLPALVDKHFGEALKQYKMIMELKLQPIEDIHLTSHFMQEFEANGDLNSVNFLFVIALFIILIAWVNYINLSTARAFSRAKEVGLRKVVGATRKQLMTQFFVETILLNLIGIILAAAIVQLTLPYFTNITGTPLYYIIWAQSWTWIAIAALFLIGVFLSGLYPVIVLSSFNPITVLKGRIGTQLKGINLRKILVLFQISIAFALLTFTLVVFKQLNFMRSQNLGVNIEQTLVVAAPRVQDDTFMDKYEVFKQEVLRYPEISKISYSSEVPGRQIYWDAGGIMKAGSDISASKNYLIMGIDYDFMDLYKLELINGRYFSKEFTDEKSLILTEKGIKWMGFENAQSALHQQVNYWGNIYTIVGVAKDYHQQSLKENFEPQIFRLITSGKRGLYSIKMSTHEIKSTIAKLNIQWENFFPGNPFEYFFLDEYYDQQYKADEEFGRVFSLFAGLALFITCLGLFGMSSFSAIQRTKEVGIRKVLGASISKILFLLTKDFLYLIIFASVVSIPIMIFAIAKWLNNFAYRMTLNWTLFIMPLVAIIFITMMTIAFQSIKSAIANPVDSIRDE